MASGAVGLKRLSMSSRNSPKAPSVALGSYVYNETRYTMLVRSQPEAAKRLLHEAEGDVAARWKTYEFLASQAGRGAQPATPAHTKEDAK